MRHFEELFLHLDRLRMGKTLCSAYFAKKTRYASHYIFYHNKELLQKVKPKEHHENLFFVNLNELPIPKELKIDKLSEEENRAVFSEYLGILQIKPRSDMVGVFTYSIPLKFCQDYVNDGAPESIFLPEIKFENLANKEFNENKLYGVEFSKYNWNGAGADALKDIDSSPFYVSPVDDYETGPFKGSVVVRKDVFLDFQKWFLGATEYLIKKYGWECKIPSGSFNQTQKYYAPCEQSKFDSEFRRKIGHIQERLMAYYFGRTFSKNDRVKLGNFLQKPALNLMVQYFTVSNQDRQKEIDDCLKKNCENSFIKKIFLLTEEKFDAEILNHPKIEQIVIGKRLKFSDAFEFANKKLPGEVFILSNADIYFDESLAKAGEYDFENLFLALSRHNHFKDGREQIIIGNPKYDTRVVQKDYNEEGGRIEWASQDAWIFKTPISQDVIDKAGFELGRLNCDGRILWLMKAFGYKVLNPCINIAIRHLHNVFFGISRQNIQEHISKTIDGSTYALNPDGSHYPAERTWIQGSSPKGKIKMYVLYTPSHQYFFENYFLPSIKDDYFLISENCEQECSTGFFEEEGWMDTMNKKVQLVIRAIKENPEKIFIHSDVDVQFFGKTKDTILRLMADKDIVFQRDRTENLEKGFLGVYCAGFFACRGNERTLKFFEDILSQLPGLQAGVNDQVILNNLLESGKYNIKIGYLPNTFWSPGIEHGDAGENGKNMYSWQPGEDIVPPDDIVMHHANWTKGIENKKNQLDFIKDKVFKKRKYW
jgi:hypothetical protein